MVEASPPGYRQGRVTLAPQGLTIPLTLQTAISTQVAEKPGLIEAQITQPVVLGDSQIPARIDCNWNDHRCKRPVVGLNVAREV